MIPSFLQRAMAHGERAEACFLAQLALVMRARAARWKMCALGLVRLHELGVALGVLAEAGGPARRVGGEVFARVCAGGSREFRARACLGGGDLGRGAAGAEEVGHERVLDLRCGGGDGEDGKGGEHCEGRGAHGMRAVI